MLCVNRKGSFCFSGSCFVGVTISTVSGDGSMAGVGSGVICFSECGAGSCRNIVEHVFGVQY